ncbi:Hsp70 protein-domain-containing protein [Lentinula raphanica]|uniref:Hsp70 protein-domain-containing protein n=1 Tax=Lentinula raphanica TaxID=153919 RepID=A0AA38P8P7_9AGAR|nr:Hsp70 protein-domain-containing protein [Lentinula raphanica]
MKETAHQFLNKNVNLAVITVPAYFNDAQRQATKDARQIAGLDVLRVINEPTAAVAYGLDKADSSIIAVYDLGGDTHLGGEDFDIVLVDHILNEFKKESGIDLSGDRMTTQRIREAVRRLRSSFLRPPKPTSTSRSSPLMPLDQRISTQKLQVRSQFESLVDPLVKRTIDPCKNALSDAGVKASEVNIVILVGGETVKTIFGRETSRSVHPYEAVAKGAAIQGGVLAGNVTDILLLESRCIETPDGIMNKLINRNTTIPTKKSEVFSPRELVRDNKLLGNFNLVRIPPAPKGVPQIEITFDIDADGVVNVSAKDKATNKDQSMTIASSSGPSDKDIEKMVADTEQYAEADKARRSLIEEVNKADSVCVDTEKAMNGFKEQIDATEKEKLVLREIAKKRQNADMIREKTNETQQASLGLFQKVYEKRNAEPSEEKPAEDAEKKD